MREYTHDFWKNAPDMGESGIVIEDMSMQQLMKWYSVYYEHIVIMGQISSRDVGKMQTIRMKLSNEFNVVSFDPDTLSFMMKTNDDKTESVRQ
jgi:hypothetical protein